MLTQGLIEAISNRTATLECFEITVTQNQKDDPLIFSGPGCLYFDREKRLRLKMYSKDTKSSSPKMLKLFFDTHEGVVPEDSYYALSAKDTYGREWKADRVLIINGYSTNPSGTILDIALESVRSKSKLSKRFSFNEAFIIVLGRFRLPFTTFVERLDGSQELAKLAIQLGDGKLEIVQSESSLQITVSNQHKTIQIEKLFYLLEGLGIGIGQLAEPSLIFTANGEQYEAYIKGSINTEKSDVVQPLIDLQNRNSEELSLFINTYVENRSVEHRHMVNYWHRLNQIPHINTEAAALVLCVNIEGMIKNYHSTNRTLDSETLEEIRQTKLIIKEIKLPANGRKAILQFLGDIKKPSNGKILTEMASEAKIDIDHVQSWKNLRHIIAHADNKVSEGSYFETFIHDLENCLRLFGTLIILCIQAKNDSKMTALPVQAV